MKVLLLTDIPPSNNFPAGIFLNQACEALKENSVCVASVTNSYLNVDYSDFLNNIKFLNLKRPVEHCKYKFRFSFLNKIIYLVLFLLNIFTIRRLSRRITHFAQSNEVDMLWCVLAGQTQIRLASLVSKSLQVPLVTMVFDPPEMEISGKQADTFSKAFLNKQFEQALRMSTVCTSISHQMASNISTNYGVHTEILYPSLPKIVSCSPNPTQTSPDEFIIGFCGTMYADDAWVAFLDALDQVNWSISGKQIKLHIFSKQQVSAEFSDLPIYYKGYLKQTETIKSLSQCDILYCPYWFSEEKRNVVMYSFPSKLTTYLAAGRPVFFHGPKYSSAWVFLNSTSNSALSLDSLNLDTIINAIKALIDSSKLRTDIVNSATLLFNAHLTNEIFAKTILKIFK